MKQRVMIAIALAGRPDLLIADEPTTALDVTIQAQVLALLKQIQEQTGMAILLITHDLGVVAQTADRVAVMYAGELVETAAARNFFALARHPYSRQLFRSLPDAAKRESRLAVIEGKVPRLDQAFSGCRFTERCELATDLCRRQSPVWDVAAERGSVRCHHWRQSAADGAPLPDAQPPSRVRQAGETLLAVADLMVHFPIRKGILQRTVGQVRAVDGVSFRLPRGRTLALVGESGCGKTTAGKAILQLIRPSAGRVVFDGSELTRLRGRALRRRRSDLQIIFQDPFSSMNPRMLVGDIVAEGLSALGAGSSAGQRSAKVAALLEQVGLDADGVDRYPHEFSGGQRQRISVARALAVNPRLLVCDEPTSALDVSVQAQVLNLLKDLQHELDLSYLFITHDISVVAYMAHEVAVMYLGRIVEQGSVDEVLQAPRHPYTEALLSAVPSVDPEGRRKVIRLQGDMPSPAHPPAGCYFHPRCPKAVAECRKCYPRVAEISDRHRVSCHLVGGAGSR